MAKNLPIFWSFRRCPYAMRARLAVRSAGIKVELREILLRDKPSAFLAASTTKTVPVLVLDDGRIIEESRDIMFWALKTSQDPEGWLAPHTNDEGAVPAFFERLDGPFKRNLDRYKYATRFAENKKEIVENQLIHRTEGAVFLSEIEVLLSKQACLSGAKMGILDYGCLPFIRQFRLANMHWFDAQDWPHLHRWLSAFLVSDRFSQIMEKYPPWHPKQAPLYF